MSRLNWIIHNSSEDSYPIASLYSDGIRLLSVYLGNGFYATYSINVIPLPWYQISFEDAEIEAKKNNDFSKLSKKEKEKLRLDAACKIIEERVKDYIVDIYLATIV